MKSTVQVIALLAVAVLVVTIWRDQGAAATSVGDVIGWVAGLLQESVEKFAGFVQEL